MARNSRFNNTSGPSSNRPQYGKGKPVGAKGRFSRKSEDQKPAAKNFDRKESSGKPSWQSSRPDERPKSGGDFAKRRVAKPYSKDTFKGKERGDDFTRKKPFPRPKEDSANSPARKSDDFARKRPRPFAIDGFKRKKTGDSLIEKKHTPPSFEGRERKNAEETNFKGDKKQGSFANSRAERPGKTFSTSTKAAEPPKDGLIRLNKFISNSGVCSRREADDLIAMGLITVNGKSVTEMGYKVQSTDDIRYEGRRLKSEKPVYILLNKPKGYITTTDDPQERNTVMQLIHGACKERVYPVGRLDRNTSGLLLLTNDGDLTDKLTHPSYKAKKLYKAELNKPLTKNDFQKILDGVRLEEGKAVVDDLAIVSEDGMTVGIEIHIGWNRVIRRIFEVLEYEVVKLDRTVYATLDKKDLPRGHWRFLRQDEVVRLKHFQ